LGSNTAAESATTSTLSPLVQAETASGLANRAEQPLLTILLPVHNEAENIEAILTRFYRHVMSGMGAELLVCEDGSTDGSAAVLQTLASRMPMRLVAGGERKGYAGAVRDGLMQVRTLYAFFADSDGQYDPAEFWRLWSRRDGYDMIIGRKVKRDEPFYRTALSRGFHILVKALFGIEFQDIDCGFRLIKDQVIQKVIGSVRDLPYSFWAEFTILAAQQGYRILEVPVSHHNRMHGSTTIYTPLSLPKILVRQVKGLVRLRRRIRSAT
jgi:glycosyltransferase involved in cell wall biosynthesis